MNVIYKKPFLESLDKKPFTEQLPPPFLTHEEPTKLKIPDEIRPQAMYIAGNPGYGKSSLIQNLVISDIKAGYGVCVIDPSGTLIRKQHGNGGIIDWIPENRIDDVIYFNTSDSIKSIDFFSYHKDDRDERTVLLDELVAIFKLENAPRAKPLLWKTINILLSANENGGNYTFTDIQTFIENPTKQREILKLAKMEWLNFPKSGDFEAITTRLIRFADDPVMKQILSSPNPDINLWDIMQNNKILLVDLKDTETDLFLGSLIVAKLQQATFRRRILPEAEHKRFFLYVDEFHAITPSSAEHFEKMLTRARKYNLCLTFANPLPDDLPSEIMRKLPSVAVKILFNLNASNASIFKDQMTPHVSVRGELREVKTANYLNNFPKFAAICIQPHQYPTLVTTPKFLPPNPASSAKKILIRTGDKSAVNDTASALMLEHDAPTTTDNADTPTHLLPNRPKKAGS
jgi:hypothetical protein